MLTGCQETLQDGGGGKGNKEFRNRFKMFGGFICDVDGLRELCGKDTGPTGFHLGERFLTLH